MVSNQMLTLDDNCEEYFLISFDQDMSSKEICKTAFYHQSNVPKLSNILSKSDIGKLIHAFVTSRLDNCNPFLSCCSKSLQLIQNATRVLTGPNRNECRFKVLLQWFHITQFKYNFFFKCFIQTCTDEACKYRYIHVKSHSF